MSKITKNRVADAMAKSMREFGYPDVDREMAVEIMDAYAEDPNGELPHDVIGMLLKAQLDDLTEHGVDIGALK